MNLELLPNEIFLDLFAYFNVIDLLGTFYGLKSRINILLYKQLQFCCFKFSSISKGKFDWLCQQHLPFIADHIIHLHLSDAQDTPGQINLFFSYISSIRQLPHLRSLIVTDLSSYKILLKLIDDCQYLSNLTHLCFKFQSGDFPLILDNIWSLSKLIYFSFNIDIQSEEISIPTKISPTLECVNIQGYGLKWNQLNRLFKCTPRLKRLSINIKSTINDDYIPYSLPTLVYLHISINREFAPAEMISLLDNTPNLQHLNIRLMSNLINGHQWEKIIHNYLPKLRVLRLNMTDTLRNRHHIQKQIDRLIDSFRSSFWIDEHKWYVRCFPTEQSIHLHTLSEAFHYGDEKPCDFWQSTYPHDNQQKFYRNITNIYDDEFFELPFPSDICLPNITYLSIKFPINKQFWSIVPNLNRLKSLDISSHSDIYQSQLQILLDHAPHLSSLHISQDNFLPLQMSLFKYTNTSVHLLDLKIYGHCFNEEECISLSYSPLGVQCEVLFISVETRESIIILIENMINLRALHVKYEPKHPPLTTSNENGIIQWLKDHLPSTCSIATDSDLLNCIRIWIG